MLRATLFVAILLPLQASATYINFNAAAMQPTSDSSASASGESGNSYNQPQYIAFSPSGSLGKAQIHTVVPQGISPGAQMRCGWKAYSSAATPSTSQACFKFYFVAYPDGGGRNLASYGTPSENMYEGGITGSTTPQLSFGPEPFGSFVTILDASTGEACASTDCNGQPFTITIQRVNTSPCTNPDELRLTDVTCEYTQG